MTHQLYGFIHRIHAIAVVVYVIKFVGEIATGTYFA